MNNQNLASADILIVDDVPENIRLLSTMLMEFGFRVRKSINGKMALMAVKALKPDLILLDINMQGINGYQVCEALKNNPETSEIPIIFVSAINQIEDKIKAFQVGGVDYITKPFQVEEVMARIHNQLKIQNLQRDLQLQNQQLKATQKQLAATQVELIQKEKMVALNQLVAGIFHELNNPINFISGNLDPAYQYVEDIIELINLYRQEYPHPSPQILARAEKLELDFILEDLQKLIRSLKTGIKRIDQIMLALRIFSRTNEAEMKSIDLHECLNSVLHLIRHRLQGNNHNIEIKVIQQKAENLPIVTCYAGLINQVIMNLINNAIDSLQSADSQAHESDWVPTIWITTEQVNPNRVAIRIRDNGMGIAPELQSRLFDPFFTTKTVGQGMGLGLATSYQIVVEKHNGQLILSSIPGEGAEFRVELPIAPIPQRSVS
ncbi:MAG: hybrid sensor histidine kinase/response regulator [Arthrospira sp. PLM2.Bin9]|nr:response regulator [Arthrospira sp. PLM2.Bin9]TVU52008.1 MAG: hybrid sensor histidine kinase/response regulator [Arthrospira sp. PLM2.Bin9]